MDRLQGNFKESQQCLPVDGDVKSEIEQATEEETGITLENNNNEETADDVNNIETVMSLDPDLLNPPTEAEEAPDNSSNPMNNNNNNPLSSNNKESDENVVGGSSGDELPSLSLMGCVHCLLYVLSLKNDPECPNCKNTDLLDVLEEYNN